MLAPKPKSENILQKSGVVYGVIRNNCISETPNNNNNNNKKMYHYIGETSRTLKNRINSHMYDKKNYSAIRNHKESTNHDNLLTENTVSVLAI